MKKSKKNVILKEEKQKSKKTVVVIILMVLAIVIGAVTLWCVKNNENKVVTEPTEVRSVLTVETGSPVPEVNNYFKHLNGSAEDFTIAYLNDDEEIEKRDELFTATYYVDAEGNEVKKDDAFESSDTEENEVLKDGYKEVVVLKGTYNYTVTIQNKNDDKEVYITKLQLEDTKAPVLKVKDVTITEGDNVDANSFFERCDDNSREACNNPYVVKEIKNEDSTTYEKTELDKSVGEREVLLRAEDASGNVSEVVKAKLTVNKKPEEPKPTTSNSSSSNKTTSGSSTTKKPSSNGSSSSSSGSSSNSGSTSKPATNTCGSKGYSIPMYKKGNPSNAYAFWGCDGSAPSNLISNMNNEFGHGAGKRELDVCNASFGDNRCGDIGKNYDIIDNATGKVVGVYFYYALTVDWGSELGEGYILPGKVVMLRKAY